MIRHDLSEARWRRSSYTADNGGQCVEVVDGIPDIVPVRDSKNPGPTLLVPGTAWTTFVDHLKH
ncbi:DUF397 domain-containing protein [Streptomyces sp. NPDC049881]|uniref:DUF397 domain-containing protein n=1 Tax=unclassified Streptomyces TaxID=2593676 RepID=UPI0034490CFF